MEYYTWTSYSFEPECLMSPLRGFDSRYLLVSQGLVPCTDGCRPCGADSLVGLEGSPIVTIYCVAAFQSEEISVTEQI